MPDQNDQQERQLERRYKVRQVTDYQASWVEGERGGNGKFTLQLILDRGVEEYILDVSADDVDVLLTLLKRARLRVRRLALLLGGVLQRVGARLLGVLRAFRRLVARFAHRFGGAGPDRVLARHRAHRVVANLARILARAVARGEHDERQQPGQHLP